MQLEIEEEQKRCEEFREQYLTTERQLNIIVLERQDFEAQKEKIDLQKQHIEIEINEQRNHKADLQNKNFQLVATKRVVENDLQLTKVAKCLKTYF